MSVITSFNYTNEANYTKNNAEVSGGFGRLAFVNNPNQTFNQDFASGSGFTFDAALAEFVGGVVRQKNRTPASSLFAANYDLNANLQWRNDAGLLIPTLVGTPTFSGGKMVVTGNQGVYYDYTTVALETYKFKYTPNYTTAPPADVNIAGSYNGVDNKDRAVLGHLSASSLIEVFVYDNLGIPKINVPFNGAWQPTAGQEYEFELNVNPATGFATLFIDGVLHDSRSAGGAFTRGGIASRFYVGSAPWAHNRAEGSFNDLIIFSNIQHTVGYAPGYSLVTTTFGETEVVLPDFNYIGLGVIKALSNLVTTEVDSPKYTFEGQYWNGAAWVASDGSYAQANSKAEAIANISSLDVDGQTAISVSVVFQNSNIIGSVDDLTLTYTGQHFPSEGSLITNNSFVASELQAIFDTVKNVPANTDIKFAFEINGVCKYHNGSAWVTSNCTNAQSNTEAEIIANAASLLTENSTVKIVIILSTTDDQITSEIDSLTVEYDFGALEPTLPVKCQVFGFLADSEDQPIANAVILVKPFRDDLQYKEAASRIIAGSISRTTDANGFFSMNLIVSSEFEPADFQYALTITLQNETDPIFLNGEFEILFTVPDVPTLNVTDQITAV